MRIRTWVSSNPLSLNIPFLPLFPLPPLKILQPTP